MVAAGFDAAAVSAERSAPPASRATAKEKVYAFLESRPAGAEMQMKSSGCC